MIAMLGPEDMTIVLLIGLVVFGGSRIPQLARSLGQAKNEFQRGLNEPPQDTSDDESKGSAPKKD